MNLNKIRECDIIKIYSFLGKEWTIILLHNINDEPLSFNNIQRMFHKKINPTLLSLRLKDFVKFKILVKKTVNGKLCYSITPEGLKLKKLLHDIKDWAIQCEYSVPNECLKGECICKYVFSD